MGQHSHCKNLTLNRMTEIIIPTDILVSILVRIPASALQRLKPVSKEWFRIISDLDFVEAHYAHQSREIFGWGIFLNTTQDIFFMEGTSVHTQILQQPMILPGASGATFVLGSCRGLVLFSSVGEGFKLHVANPITGESLVLPPFWGYNITPMNANIVCCDREFKVVVVGKHLIHTSTTPYICGILTLGSSSWKEMHTPIAGHRLEKHVVFTRGALHWCYDAGILSLDLGEEKFHQVEVTFCSSIACGKHGVYVEWDGCFAAVFPQTQQHPSPFYTVGILRESEWVKQPDIDNAFFKRLGYAVYGCGPYFCTTMRSGEILLFVELSLDLACILMCDLSRQVVTKFTQFRTEFLERYSHPGKFSLVPHVNSLVSCSSSLSPPKRRIGIRSTLVFSLLSKFSDFAWIMRNLFNLFTSSVSCISLAGRKPTNDV